MKATGTIATLIISTMVFASGAHAQTRGGLEAGAGVFDYNYREKVDGETIVYDDGAFGGFDVNYVETIGNNMFLRAKLFAAVGSVDYRSPDTTGEERLENVKQGVGQLELQLGLDFPIGGGATLSPFVGLASRALIDESGSEVTASGLSGYDREIGYTYIPVGAALRIPVGRNAIILSAQYNFVMSGTSESKFSGISPDLPDVEVDLTGGHGFEANAAYEIPLGKHAISFGPFLRQWTLKQSKSFTLTNPENPSEVIELFEPASRTTEVGLRLLFAF